MINNFPTSKLHSPLMMGKWNSRTLRFDTIVLMTDKTSMNSWFRSSFIIFYSIQVSREFDKDNETDWRHIFWTSQLLSAELFSDMWSGLNGCHSMYALCQCLKKYIDRSRSRTLSGSLFLSKSGRISVKTLNSLHLFKICIHAFSAPLFQLWKSGILFIDCYWQIFCTICTLWNFDNVIDIFQKSIIHWWIEMILKRIDLLLYRNHPVIFIGHLKKIKIIFWHKSEHFYS